MFVLFASENTKRKLVLHWKNLQSTKKYGEVLWLFLFKRAYF